MAERKSKAYRMVCGLWINPDFSKVLSGRAQPPRVNHAAVDFSALHRALSDLFPHGPPVRIQVPNDTIDQVAVHVRQTGQAGASIRCEDFGKALLRASSTDQDVIDIRRDWTQLHALPDRDFAPPPVILPFVVTATDFEDAMIWHASTRPTLGLPLFDPMAAMGTAKQQEAESGNLPKAFRERLKSIFNTPYEAMGLLDRMAADSPPAEYGFARGTF